MTRLNWFLSVIIAALAVNLLIHAANSTGYDPTVAFFESQYNLHPGDPLPQDWRTPNTRLRYKGTTPIGNGCYQVNICRAR